MKAVLIALPCVKATRDPLLETTVRNESEDTFVENLPVYGLDIAVPAEAGVACVLERVWAVQAPSSRPATYLACRASSGVPTWGQATGTEGVMTAPARASDATRQKSLRRGMQSRHGEHLATGVPTDAGIMA